MSPPDVHRQLQNTNVWDLLDDGIENGSDLRARPRGADPGPAAGVDAPVAPAPRTTLTARTQPESTTEPVRSNRAISWFGLALGLAMIVAGLLVAWHPHSMVVYHAPTRHAHGSSEFVTAREAQGCGWISVILGLTIGAFSVYRPRS